ncbi:hypothetical protein HBN71_21435 [Pseudomonas lundensis]|uniref:hypothetical protein n=1 Tax=Pseudomonas TaxID=286 RepID=UPI000642419C|nr:MULTISPECIES: hypothetical protein [Pseudomonas]NNA13709.1 hypothetical protein [Pseudomonas lundensis]
MIDIADNDWVKKMLVRNYYPRYSRFFFTEYEERGPYIDDGQSVRYSIFQSIQWRDNNARLLLGATIQRIGIAWGVFSETRLFFFLDDALAKGLLSPVLFICARYGNVTIVVDDSDFTRSEEFEWGWNAIVSDADDPYWWSVSIKSLGSGDFVAEDMPKVTEKYIKNIDDFWGLGLRPYNTMALIPFDMNDYDASQYCDFIG